MRSPKEMKIIQIDITNACPNSCSNCTRFCGHHKKPYFMDFSTFEKAVDSLDGFSGMLGIIGGEPTIHPEFEKFAVFLQSHKRVREKERKHKWREFHLRWPQSDFLKYILKRMQYIDEAVGLWSSLGISYYRHMEVINDTFRTQFLNDHQNLCEHQALLMSRKELGICDDEWSKKRDACWIQNTWSATITPKGAFFCEVAAHLDMLFQGSGGWPIEPGWWQREPKDFGYQLDWCERCSACLDVPKRLSTDGRDDVTPKLYEELLAIGSPKANKGLSVVHNPSDPSAIDKNSHHSYRSADEYMRNAGNKRINIKNRTCYPKTFTACMPDQINDVLVSGQADDWVLVCDDKQLVGEAQNYFHNKVINPGCLYIYRQKLLAFNVHAKSIREYIHNKKSLPTQIWGLYPIDKIISIVQGNDMEHEIIHTMDSIRMHMINKKIKCIQE